MKEEVVEGQPDEPGNDWMRCISREGETEPSRGTGMGRNAG
jgi:hypothetical protein